MGVGISGIGLFEDDFIGGGELFDAKLNSAPVSDFEII
jgi:hypothetical protein